MKAATILLNLALTATAMAAALKVTDAGLEKRDCDHLGTDPTNPNRLCVNPGCFGLTANACCTYQWDQYNAICK